MESNELPTEYRVEIPYGEHAGLNLLMFSHQEHRWLFEYRYVAGEDHKVDILNKYRLVIDYTDGIASGEVVLSMEIVFPERRGQEYLCGVDISRNSKVFIQFRYRKETGSDVPAYRLEEFEVGCGKVYKLENPEAGALINPVEFPFEVRDRITRESGLFRVPFKVDETRSDDFSFPNNIVKPLNRMC